MMMWTTALTFIALVALGECTMKLQELFAWNIVDYAYPNEQMRQRDIMTKRFVPENALPVGIEVWRNKLFVSVPRWMGGIPATLNYVPLDSQLTKSPPLIPYPSWEANEVGNCERGLTTVYRIKADKCDRLWVLDTGTFGIGNTTTNPCPYALNVIDLNTDRRIRRYEFRPEDTNARTFIANIAVDIGAGGCDDAYAYFSDELGYGLIAYSWKENRSWRFEHSYLMPDPLAGDFNIGGLNFQWGEEGIFGMALSPPVGPSGHRVLFFSPLASDREFAVSTAILRNSSRVEDSYHDFVVLEKRAPLSHTTSRVMTDDGIMFFNLIDRNSVGCWNSATSYTPANHDVVDRDDEALIFPADVKVDANRNLWVISDKMPNFLIDRLDYNDINFRVFFAPVDVLVQGTVCEPKNSLYPEPQTNSVSLPVVKAISTYRPIQRKTYAYSQPDHRFTHYITY